jgi:hypothetical protein
MVAADASNPQLPPASSEPVETQSSGCWRDSVDELIIPDGFLSFSDAVNRLAQGIWGGKRRPAPVQAVKRNYFVCPFRRRNSGFVVEKR